MGKNDGIQRVVAVGRGAERSAGQPPKPGPEHQLLEAFIGRWMTRGTTVAISGQASLDITASDVYEWMPGRFFVLHTAYGLIGADEVGGTEIIGYDPATGGYRSSFFDSFGNSTTSAMTVRDGVWTVQGESTRATANFTDGGKTLITHHERLDDGEQWVPSMEVILSRIE